MTRRAIIVFGMVGLLGGLMAPAAYGKADAITETVQGVTETFADANPCTGDTGDVTVTYNGIFHFTIDPNEGEHFTGTQTGTFLFQPDDPEAETVTGKFTVWFGGNITGNNAGFWVTNLIRGSGSEGSRFVFNLNEQFHFSNGELQVEFSLGDCH
ncbi:MAG TPA: hypothetical protein VEB69_11955 [Acidimicrobiia bacterium]|nr:hypothetical protein [Acidimicrobiia bacterium]